MRKAAVVLAMVLAWPLPSAPAVARPAWFRIQASANGTKAKFSYLLSLPGQGGAETGWTAGDRVAYRCAYAFLRSGGQLVARVTFTRIEYANINDKYMDEGSRYYDGTVYTGTHHQLNDCPGASEPYVDVSGPIGPLPVVTFADADSSSILEVRDYAHVTQNGGGIPWQFKIVSATPDRVTVVGYQSGEPALAIYYDRLSPSITLTSNFTSG
ncbi:MAG: hypothetical protein ACRDH7_04825 [Actinomycetota bacterium]